MNAHAMSPTLDDVLDDFALADPEPHHVSEWTDRYLHFADDIRAFAEEWFAMANPSEDELEASERDALLGDRDRFVKKGIALMQQQLTETQPVPAPQSLSELLTRRSVTRRQLRSMLGLSRRFLSSITEHPVIRDTPEAATIWDRIVSAFADVLDAPREWVTDVLDAVASPSLSFSRSDSRPVADEPIDLVELVKSDSRLDPRTRQYFLTGEGSIPSKIETDE